MLLELIFKMFFGLVGFVLDFIPDFSDLGSLSKFADDLTYFIGLLSYGFVLFPFELFVFFISNVLFWLNIQLSWAVVEWVYKKVPGVN